MQNGAGQPQAPLGQGAVVDAATAAGASQQQQQRGLFQQFPAQPLQQSSRQPEHVVTVQTTAQMQQNAQQAQQPTATNQELGIWPQFVQQQQRVQFSPQVQQVQPLQQQNAPPYQQPAPTSAPDLGAFAQYLPATTPIAIPASAVMQQHKLLRAQPSGASPSSLTSSQPSAAAQHGSIVSSGGLTQRAGSARPDALSQLQLQQQPTESPSRFVASSVQNSFKQREAISAAAVATGGVELTGSTAPLSLLGAVQHPQRFSGMWHVTSAVCSSMAGRAWICVLGHNNNFYCMVSRCISMGGTCARVGNATYTSNRVSYNSNHCQPPHWHGTHFRTKCPPPPRHPTPRLVVCSSWWSVQQEPESPHQSLHRWWFRHHSSDISAADTAVTRHITGTACGRGEQVEAAGQACYC